MKSMSSGMKYSLVVLMLIFSGRSYGKEVQPLKLFLVEGQNTTIECSHYEPLLECDWSKDGNNGMQYRGSRYAVLGNLEDGNCTLRITNVQMKDAGHWRCQLTMTSNDTSESIQSLGNTIKSTSAYVSVESLNYHRIIERHPQNKTVVQNMYVILECEFNGPSQKCYWMKDGEIIAIEDKYRYIGERGQGNCSLNITHMDIESVGLWQCGYPRSRGRASLKSQVAEVNIGVASGDPVIVYNGIPMKDGDQIYINREGDKMCIWCYSKYGNPAATLQWKLDGTDIEPPYVEDQFYHSRLYQPLWISRTQLKKSFLSSDNEKNLSCEAMHPLYTEKTRIVQVQLMIPESASSDSYARFRVSRDCDDNNYNRYY